MPEEEKKIKVRKGQLSVVVPAYNEAKNIKKTVETINGILIKRKIKYEIIFVDDGSSDNTWDVVARESKKMPVRGIKFSRNFGKESAIIAGLAEAGGDCAVVIDCDLQHPPEKIVEMYEKWQEGYDVVEGVKETRGKEGAIHKLGAKAFYKIMSSVMKIDMENASDFKLLDKQAVRTLINIPEKNAFFRALSSWIGYKTTTVKYDVGERAEGDSKWSFSQLIKYALSNITSFTTMPMQIITILGIIILVVAIILTIIAIHDYVAGTALGGFTTVIILICFTSSVIMISLGIIGYYVSKILEQVQARPKYIIEKKVE